MALSQFLGALGALGASNLGSPRSGPIRMIDPDTGQPISAPIATYPPGMEPPTQGVPAMQSGGQDGVRSPRWLEQFLGDTPPLAQIDTGQLLSGLQTPGLQALGSRPPEAAQPGGRFLGISNSGLRDFLGTLGDSLLAANDAPLLYTPRKQQRETGRALAQFVGADSPLAQIAMQDPAMFERLYGGQQQQQRFDTTTGLDRERIGLSREELAERQRAEEERARLTARGQDITSGTQLTLQQQRAEADAALARLNGQIQTARDAGNHARERDLTTLRETLKRETAALGGGDPGTVTESVVEETEATPEVTERGGFLGIGAREGQPAIPARKTTTTTKRPAPRTVTTQAQINALPKGSEFVWTDGQRYRKD